MGIPIFRIGADGNLYNNEKRMLNTDDQTKYNFDILHNNFTNATDVLTVTGNRSFPLPTLSRGGAGQALTQDGDTIVVGRPGRLDLAIDAEATNITASSLADNAIALGIILNDTVLSNVFVDNVFPSLANKRCILSKSLSIPVQTGDRIGFYITYYNTTSAQINYGRANISFAFSDL